MNNGVQASSILSYGVSYLDQSIPLEAFWLLQYFVIKGPNDKFKASAGKIKEYLEAKEPQLKGRLSSSVIRRLLNEAGCVTVPGGKRTDYLLTIRESKKKNKKEKGIFERIFLGAIRNGQEDDGDSAGRDKSSQMV